MSDPLSDLTASISARHAKVLETLAASARKAGRVPESVRLVVVTKSQSLDVVEAAIRAGATVLGENYAEEAAAKIQGLRDRAAGRQWDAVTSQAGSGSAPAVEWHMVGHVQGRKAKLVAQYFALVHSLDSLKLAERLARAAGELRREIPVLLEFNVGGESGKQGWMAADEALWPGLLPEVEAVTALSGLRIEGLMTMPPLSTNPESARTYFRRLRRLQRFLEARFPQVDWTELSMGTSVDYPVAVEEGATLVRVGQAILGPRPEPEEP
jgi:pyridoxal phosphate enzyme (YggS family)